MALQWTPLRLMVSGDGVPHSRSDTLLRSPRKMTDRATQYEPTEQETELLDIESPTATCTVAEINMTESTPNATPTRPVSVEFTNSLGRERRRTISENIDEILVQSVNSNEKPQAEPEVVIIGDKTEVDAVQNENQDSCCLDCLYFSLKCCECTIL